MTQLSKPALRALNRCTLDWDEDALDSLLHVLSLDANLPDETVWGPGSREDAIQLRDELAAMTWQELQSMSRAIAVGIQTSAARAGRSKSPKKSSARRNGRLGGRPKSR